jgi:cysteine desulfurase
MSRPIYFDYAAATPLDELVLAAMLPYLNDKFYNPSAGYLAAKAVRHDIDRARAAVAKTIGVRPAEVIFTAGATEANNLAISGFHQRFPEAEILVSAVEHESVLAPARVAGAKHIPVSTDGTVDLNWLARHITASTGLVSLIHTNHELGALQPLHEVAALVASERQSRLKKGNSQPIYLHTDAAQAANFFDLQVGRLGVDLLSLNGGKIYGPKQSGLLYVRAGTKLAAQILGGGQEFGLRSGTENVAAVIGLAKALELATQSRQVEAERLTKLRRELEARLAEIYPVVVINGGKKRAPHIVSASFIGQDNERLMMELDEHGLAVAVGSACSAGRGDLSPVLTAIGLSHDQISSTLRFSLGRQTKRSDVARLITELSKILKTGR